MPNFVSQVTETEDLDEFGLERNPPGDTNYVIGEDGVRRRIYVPMSERQAENYR